MRASTIGVVLISLAASVAADPPAPKSGDPATPAAKPPAPSRAPASAAPTIEEAAKAALAAIDGKDDAALVSLATRDDVDPWLVADTLVGRGAIDAAVMYADKAKFRPGVDRLPAYVTSRRDRPAWSEARAKFEVARSALRADAPERAREALDSIADPVDGVLALRIAFLKARLPSSDAKAGWNSLHALAESAQALGWPRFAAQAEEEIARSAHPAGDYETALTAARRSLVHAEAVELPRSVALAAFWIGSSLTRLGRAIEAIPPFERVVSIRERLGDEIALAHALVDLASCEAALGDHAKARATYERELAVFERIGDESGAGVTHISIAVESNALGDTDAGLASYERALATFERLENLGRVADVEGRIGSLFARRQEASKAREWLDRALKTAEASGDERAVAKALVAVGTERAYRDAPLEAIAPLERAMAIYERRGDAEGQADAAMALGNANFFAGRLPKAREHYEHALKLYAGRGELAKLVPCRQNLGAVLSDLGEFAKALEVGEEAVDGARRLGDRSLLASSLLNLGVLYHALGHEDRALAIHEEDLRLQERMGGGGVRLAVAHINVAAALQSMKEYERAITHLEKALPLCDAAHDHSKSSVVRRSIAQIHVLAGRPADSIPLLDRALSDATAAGDDVGVGEVLLARGDSKNALHDYRGAQESYGKALEILRTAGRADLVVHALRCLARAHVDLDQGKEALAASHAAVDLLDDIASGLSDESSASLRTKRKGAYDEGVRSAFFVEDSKEIAYFLESGRASTLLQALGSRDALRAAILSPELAELDRAARARLKTATAASVRRSGATAASLAAADAELAEAKTAMIQATERIEREAKAAAGVLRPTIASLAEIQKHVAADEILVLFGFGGDSAVALIVSPTDARPVIIGPRDDIEAACAAAITGDADALSLTELEKIRARVIAPLAIGADVRRVVVSPAGFLGYLPFGALMPDRDVAVTPSGSVFVALSRSPAASGDGVLALGDPAYTERGSHPEDSSPSDAERATRLARLPSSRDEAKAIGDVVLLGDEASIPDLRKAVLGRRRWRAIHFACHALVDREQPMRSAIALTPRDADDGLLTAYDVLRLATPADLIVLSACETGKGRIYEAEGIVGLTRAFMYSGAPRVIASLWKVDDRATSMLMKAFYDGWRKRGLSPAAALREAQRTVREHEESAVDVEASRRAGRDVTVRRRPFEAPKYWAAWVLWGLPR